MGKSRRLRRDPKVKAKGLLPVHKRGTARVIRVATPGGKIRVMRVLKKKGGKP